MSVDRDLLRLGHVVVNDDRMARAVDSAGARHPRSFSIVPAGPDDAEGIAACLSAAFEPYRKQYTAAAYGQTVATTGGVVDEIGAMTVLIARNRLGTIIGMTSGESRGSEGRIRTVAVLPTVQGRGVAGELLDRIESKLAADGCTAVTIHATAPLARAKRFYERNGYLRSGVVSDFFGMRLYEYRKRVRPR